MSKVGAAGQIINFNYVHEFVSENLNKILYSAFTPGVLKFTYTDPPSPTEVEITEFSALIRPYYQDFLVKVDTLTSLKLVADSTKPYLVARMDWLTPPNGYTYTSASYGTSGYSGYFVDSQISCTLDPVADKVISTDHSVVVGDIVRFTSTLAGITANTDYYVIEADTNTFKISTTATGDAVDITSAVVVANYYRKMTCHIVRFDMLAETEVNSSYDIVLAVLTFTGGLLTSIDTTDQTQVYLTDYCINYDLIQSSGVRTLIGTNPSYIDDGTTHRQVGNASGNIPLSNSTMNTNLNAQYLNGITAGNAPNNIGIKNNILSRNMVAARLFLNGFEYAFGQSGVTTYSGFSGYTGISGWSGASGFSSYSGYLPISNSVLQTSLNVEYFGGYKLSDFTPVGHTHNLDEINDGTTYARIYGVGVDGLLTTNSLNDEALEYRHQSTATPFRYDSTNKKKIFMLAGEVGIGGSTTVTFRKTFATAPKVFLLNNETNEWKAVDEANISTTGFVVHHHENTSGASLVANTTAFTTHWLAVGELV